MYIGLCMDDGVARHGAACGGVSFLVTFFFCNGLPCKLCDPGVYVVQWLSVYRSLKNSEAAM